MGMVAEVMDGKLVLIIDVINSGRHTHFALERDRALARLDRAQTRPRYRHAITAWDEIQFLLDQPADLPEFYWQLVSQFQPLQLRMGIGLGEVSIAEAIGDGERGINEIGFGPAFEAARASLEQLSHRGKQVSESNVLVTVDHLPHHIALSSATIQASCNAILAPLAVLVQDISPKQWSVIAAWNALGRSQTETARTLGVNVSTVSRSLNRARVWLVIETLAHFEKMLRDIFVSKLTKS